MNLGKSALFFVALITAFSLSRAVAFADDVEAELDAEEANLKKSLEEMQARKEGVRNDYLRNQNSEAAHLKYVITLMSDKNVAEAENVIKHWKSINPKSRRAEVLQSELNDRKAVGGERLSPEKERSYMQQLQEAGVADAVGGARLEDVSKMMRGGSAEEFMKAAQETADREKAELKKAYPELCDARLPMETQMQEWEIKSKVIELRTNKGLEGLDAEYPKIYSQHPDFQGVAVDYAKYLLERKKYKEVLDVSSEGRKRFPKSIAFRILEAGLKAISAGQSDELNDSQARQIARDLLTLATCEMDCK